MPLTAQSLKFLKDLQDSGIDTSKLGEQNQQVFNSPHLNILTSTVEAEEAQNIEDLTNYVSFREAVKTLPEGSDTYNIALTALQALETKFVQQGVSLDTLETVTYQDIQTYKQTPPPAATTTTTEEKPTTMTPEELKKITDDMTVLSASTLLGSVDVNSVMTNALLTYNNLTGQAATPEQLSAASKAASEALRQGKTVNGVVEEAFGIPKIREELATKARQQELQQAIEEGKKLGRLEVTTTTPTTESSNLSKLLPPKPATQEQGQQPANTSFVKPVPIGREQRRNNFMEHVHGNSSSATNVVG